VSLAVLEAPELLAEILSHMQTQQLFLCAAVSTRFLGAINTPGAAHTHVLLDVTKGRRRLSVAWLEKHLRRDGAFAKAETLCLLGFRMAYIYETKFDHLSNLVKLDLERCPGVGDVTLKSLAALTKLRHISLLCAVPGEYSSRYSDAGLKAIADLPLASLKLDACAQAVSNEGLRALQALGATLAAFVLSGSDGWESCWTDAETLEIIAESFPSLGFLNLSGIGVSSHAVMETSESEALSAYNQAFEHLGRLKHLCGFYGIETELSAVGIAGICAATTLEELDLSYCKMSNASLQPLRSLLKLVDLNLSQFDNGSGQTKEDALEHWEEHSRVTDAGLGHLVYLAEWGDLEHVNVCGHCRIFSGAFEALVSEPLLLSYGKGGGYKRVSMQAPYPKPLPTYWKAYRQYKDRFWWRQHYPVGPHATRLIELGVMKVPALDEEVELEGEEEEEEQEDEDDDEDEASEDESDQGDDEGDEEAGDEAL